ncbi:hypothetical protein FJ930_26110 [Mesorhizobium sp. B2-4-15]|uniref:hypothetical protein n=1 Tax=Mesorhizobium sp. B2-4-15 TaxID=2589934 RepID=UPI00114E3106|nr:hypothetical protein [Mesorhizobium sp. B2-4-15]TPK63857.1 hypothetical protein FJ930_26110 [Mesorhizobium sp. B2-4-15]
MAAKWQVETLRLTVFLNEAAKGSEAEWTALTGQDEAELRQTVPAGRVYAGEYGPGRLNLSFQGSRVDVVLTQNPSTETVAEWPTFASFEDGFPAFVETALGWFESTAYSVIRIAFGCIVLLKTDGVEDTNRALSKYVRSARIEDRVKDFLLRTNWPTKSNVTGSELNRITSFGALRVLTGQFRMGPESGTVSLNDPTFGVRLEIDHSTDAANTTPFEKTLLIPIFEELVNLARENVESGECP